jgi:hypothetical protein
LLDAVTEVIVGNAFIVTVTLADKAVEQEGENKPHQSIDK